MGDMTTAAPTEVPRRTGARKASPWMEQHVQEMADLLIKQLREGTAPWQKPWAPGERALPCNLASGRDYSGFNAISLAATAQVRGYSAPGWGTYRQIAQVGGQVRKGEKGTGIVVVKYRGQKLVTDEAGKPTLSPEGKKMYRTFPLKHPFTRGYTVFNAEQAKGLPAPPHSAQTRDWDPVEKADATAARVRRKDRVPGGRPGLLFPGLGQDHTAQSGGSSSPPSGSTRPPCMN